MSASAQPPQALEVDGSSSSHAPESGVGDRAPRWWVVVLVCLAVGAGAWALAPSSWPTGAGRLVVEVGGRQVSVPVEVGDTTPQSLTGTGGDVQVHLPDGVPVDGSVLVEVTGSAVTDRTRAADVEVTLVDVAGGEHLLPVMGVEDGVATARRQAPDHARAVLVLLAVVVVLWVTEAVPLWVTSLAIPVALVLSGADNATTALAPFAHPIIALFFAGYLMAEAMRHVGLDRRVAVEVVARSGGGPLRLYLAILGLAAFLSMWMSNTAAVAVLIPIAMVVTEPLGSLGYRKAVVLGLAYAATVGGTGSLIGTTANPLAATFLRSEVGYEITFVRWFAFGLPLLLLLVPIVALGLWWRIGERPDAARFAAARETAIAERASLPALGTEARTVLIVFVLVAAGWLTQTWHHVEAGIVAVAGAVALAVLGRLTTGDLGRISWSTLLTFGGGLTLGLALTTSGVSDAVAVALSGLQALPAEVSVALVALVALLMTAVASNTATAATLIPLSIPLAVLLGVDPVRLVVTVALASSVDFALVIGTPPTMLAYSTGMFKVREIFRIGLAFDLAGILLVVVALPWIWSLLGVL